MKYANIEFRLAENVKWAFFAAFVCVAVNAAENPDGKQTVTNVLKTAWGRK